MGRPEPPPAPLVCSGCASTGHAASERFCPDCGSPLVLAAAEDAGVAAAAAIAREDPRRERARKVRPAYGEGPLVRVAAARNQPEAELLQGLLLEEGVPSLARRSGGFDVPDFLASGPRDILVPQSGALAAREVLGIDPAAAGMRPPRLTPRAPAAVWVRIMAALLAGLLLVAVLAGVLGAIGLL